MFSDNLLTQIKNHALWTAPEECCGLFVKIENGLMAIEAKNISKLDKNHHFTIDFQAFLEAEKVGEVKGYYHSHNSEVDGYIFSEIDLKNFKIHNLFSVIYNVKENQFYFLTDGDRLTYIGRKFKIGKEDCFSLVREYYKKELNITIMDYARDSKWYVKEPEIWVKNREKEGFTIIYEGNDFTLSNLKPHDVLLSKFRDIPYPSHAAVYVGNGMVLHHPATKYSTIEPLCGEIKDKTVVILRHKSLVTNETKRCKN